MTSAGVKLSGINELITALAPAQINKRTAIASGQAIKGLHALIRAHVKKKYAAQNDLDKRLLKKSSSSITGGRGLFKNGLEYQNKFSDLSKFPTTWVWGNITAGARKKGRVHSTEVKRGKKKVVYGKGNGGFMPRDKQGRASTFGKFGTQMFERRGAKKKDLRLLLGPSTEMMIDSALRDTEVKAYIANLAGKLTKSIIE